MSSSPPQASDVVAVPLDPYWEIVRVHEGGDLEPLTALPVAREAEVRRDDDGRWWALDHDARVIEGFALDGDGVRSLGRWPLPDLLTPKDVAARGDRLFVSGSWDWMRSDFAREGPCVHVTSAIAPGAPWTALECGYPERHYALEKAIDALVVDGNRLVAIDDVVLPKYLYTYDLAGEGVPVWTYAAVFKTGLNEEVVPGAAKGSRWIAVATRSVRMESFARSVLLLARETLDLCANLGEGKGWPRRDPDSGRQRSLKEMQADFEWRSIAFVGDVLGVADDVRGLGLIDVRDLSTERLPAKWVTSKASEWDPARRAFFPSEWRRQVFPLHDLATRTHWQAPTIGHRAVATVAVDARDGFILVEESPSGARSMRWFPLPASTQHA